MRGRSIDRSNAGGGYFRLEDRLTSAFDCSQASRRYVPKYLRLNVVTVRRETRTLQTRIGLSWFCITGDASRKALDVRRPMSLSGAATSTSLRNCCLAPLSPLLYLPDINHHLRLYNNFPSQSSSWSHLTKPQTSASTRKEASTRHSRRGSWRQTSRASVPGEHGSEHCQRHRHQTSQYHHHQQATSRVSRIEKHAAPLPLAWLLFLHREVIIEAASWQLRRSVSDDVTKPLPQLSLTVRSRSPPLTRPTLTREQNLLRSRPRQASEPSCSLELAPCLTNVPHHSK